MKGTIRLDVDQRVTVLLGSNDHGKSNLLKALLHMNDETAITAEEANWDAEAPPAIEYVFELNDAEQKAWNTGGQKLEPSESPEATGQENPEKQTSKVMAPEPLVRNIVASRRNVGGQFEINGIPLAQLPQHQAQLFAKNKPRVELFKTLTGNLQDSATPQTIATDEYEFMQGVFFHAGLDPLKNANLFTQSDTSMRVLDKASKKLDRSLRELWGQGTDLSFELRHQGGTIEFLADDPSVTSRKARMSKRSDGVTQFFRVSMILHARMKKNPSNKYIFLFDEPGVFLHPQGQKDLMQVFERLSGQSQIVYATHSLFMLNQNFPERHRLIFKDQDGTKVDQKPYRANWRLATDALGVHLTSNILFSNRVLLVEGDSDPIYVYELLRQLNSLGEVDADSNTLGVMSFYDYKNLRFLLQVFKREAPDSRVLVVVDGDPQGKATVDRVNP
ncbi:MAG: ATP-dependent nuclease, partial [Nitrososphaerales archaeon]